MRKITINGFDFIPKKVDPRDYYTFLDCLIPNDNFSFDKESRISVNPNKIKYIYEDQNQKYFILKDGGQQIFYKKQTN